VTAERPLVLSLALPGPGPDVWLAEHLAGQYDKWASGASGSPVSVDGIVANGAEVLAAAHRRLVAAGTPAPAAAIYLAGWFGGALADATGFVLAAAGAGLLVDPGTVRLTLHPGGWPERVHPAPRVVVAGDHPWAARPPAPETGAEVTVVERPEQVVRAAVEALVATATPLVEACRGLARVGRAGLWNEIGDRLGAALAFVQLDLPVTPAMVRILAAATSAPGVPWRARPRLGFAASALLGRVHVVQKGGCCLAYTAPPPSPEDAGRMDDERGFADLPGTPHYCSTCSFRPAGDCDARQILWLEQEHARRLAPNPIGGHSP
jgi:hypothetical protein